MHDYIYISLSLYIYIYIYVTFIPMPLHRKVYRPDAVPLCSQKMFYKPSWAWARV